MSVNFFDYLDKNYNQIKFYNRIGFCFKEIPSTFSEYYQRVIKEKKISWKPETLSVISYVGGIDKNEISRIKRDVKLLKRNSKDCTCKIEKIPKWLLKFYKVCWGLSVFQDSIVLSTSPAQNTACIKPKCLNGKFLIGQYAGTTPESCPIFTDESGKIYVYEAENFRNYPTTDSTEETGKYINQEVKLIAFWEDIDTFLIEETERLKELFIKEPSIYAIKNCTPHK